MLERSAALLDAEDPGRLQLLLDLSGALDEQGRFQRAGELVTEVIETARLTHQPGLALRGEVEASLLQLRTAQNLNSDELLAMAQRAIAGFAAIHDEAGLARGWLLQTFINMVDLHCAATVEAADRTLAHATRVGR